MHLLTAWHQPLACYISAKHENNLYRSLQIAAKTGALIRKALYHLFNSCSTQKVFMDTNFSSSLTCVVSLYAQNIIPPCAFFLVYIYSRFPCHCSNLSRSVFKAFFKGRRKRWNKGCLLSAMDYTARFHLWVPRGYRRVPCACQHVSLHKPSLLPCNNHQLSQTADLLTKQTRLNFAICKCTTIFLIAKNLSFLHS